MIDIVEQTMICREANLLRRGRAASNNGKKISAASRAIRRASHGQDLQPRKSFREQALKP
jgi:hypothetical protein